MDKFRNMKFSSVDEYLNAIPETSRPWMEEIRQLVRTMVPDATEVISYNMPAFRYHGILLYYAAHKEHIGFYPANAKLIEDFKTELTDYRTSKGAIQFPLNKPLPLELIRRIVARRVKEKVNGK